MKVSFFKYCLVALSTIHYQRFLLVESTTVFIILKAFNSAKGSLRLAGSTLIYSFSQHTSGAGELRDLKEIDINNTECNN